MIQVSEHGARLESAKERIRVAIAQLREAPIPMPEVERRNAYKASLFARRIRAAMAEARKAGDVRRWREYMGKVA